MKALVALALVSSIIAGCLPTYGVTRRASLQRLPDSACLESVLNALPGITTVKASTDTGEDVTTRAGSRRPAYVIHTLMFHGDPASHIDGAAQISDYADGRKEFRLSLVEIKKKPPQETVDRTRQVMAEIERRAEYQCDIPNLHAAMKESCYGVKCSAI